MVWMIGIDEAGYGPNLGPLVVALTAWRVEEPEVGGQGARNVTSVVAPSDTNVDLYQKLSALVAPTSTDNQLAIADSKVLYKPGGGLRALERGVLTALATVCDGSESPDSWSELFPDAPSVPWYADFNCPLPIDATAAELSELAERFTTCCQAAGVQLVDVRKAVVFPREFNELTEYHGTKGAALSHVSLALLREAIDALPSSPQPLDTIQITCDKHGGRNRYAALLQHHFPEQWIETLGESRPISRYTWEKSEQRVEIAFRARGETELPTALASMTAKYHRELGMRAFNNYWCQQIPGLKPTAGYPLDARRFRSDIAVRQKALGINDRDLWRDR